MRPDGNDDVYRCAQLVPKSQAQHLGREALARFHQLSKGCLMPVFTRAVFILLAKMLLASREYATLECER